MYITVTLKLNSIEFYSQIIKHIIVLVGTNCDPTMESLAITIKRNISTSLAIWTKTYMMMVMTLLANINSYISVSNKSFSPIDVDTVWHIHICVYVPSTSRIKWICEMQYQCHLERVTILRKQEENDIAIGKIILIVLLCFEP